MKKTSHLLMGRLLFEYLEQHFQVALSRRRFLLGNVLPDYLPSFLSRPHFLKYSTGHVKKLTRKLLLRFPLAFESEKRRAKYVLRLGMLCHFYTDFFCHAHSPRFKEGPRRHAAYESTLALYFGDNYERIKELGVLAKAGECADAEEIFARFERLQQRYLKAEQAFLNDIVFGLYACVELIGLLAQSAVGVGRELETA
ncbi:MAG TPA: zinc dependent phospholipase C family protein [Feifaniaceae bacterium]|nr:zinc dependent phospholipase C family protein [Feifaniaceae bacterium]